MACTIFEIASTRKNARASDRTWRAQVRVNGHTKSKNFPTKAEATDWAHKEETRLKVSGDSPAVASEKKPFAELVTRYRESVMKEAGAESKAVREQHLEWFSARFAGRTLSQITPSVIAEARDALAAEKFTRGKARTVKGVIVPLTEYKRAGSTVNRYLATLSHLFTMAVKEWRMVDRNPVRDIVKKKEARGRVRFLSDTERDALLDACSKSEWSGLLVLVLLAISTGARRGELINLKWDNVDLRLREAGVDPKTGQKVSAVGRAIVHDTKNGDSRALPLVGRALDVLRELRLQGGAKSEWVFPQPSGLPGPYENFDGVWYDALELAGIEDFRFHDLRHTCASYLASQGASLLEIADVLGHRTMSMVKRYSHLAQSHKVSVVERMASERGL